MEIEALYDMTEMHPYDLNGILVSEDKMCGIVNNYPPRRNAVPYETIELYTNNNRTFRVYVKTPELNIVSVTCFHQVYSDFRTGFNRFSGPR